MIHRISRLLIYNVYFGAADWIHPYFALFSSCEHRTSVSYSRRKTCAQAIDRFRVIKLPARVSQIWFKNLMYWQKEVNIRGKLNKYIWYLFMIMIKFMVMIKTIANFLFTVRKLSMTNDWQIWIRSCFHIKFWFLQNSFVGDDNISLSIVIYVFILILVSYQLASPGRFAVYYNLSLIF